MYLRQYYEANREQTRLKRRQYYQTHRESIAKRRKEWRENNREAARYFMKEYREKRERQNIWNDIAATIGLLSLREKEN